MAKQDDWKRITLRIPPALYDRVAEAAGAASVNAEIVRRLEESFLHPGPIAEIDIPAVVGGGTTVSASFDRLIKELYELKQQTEQVAGKISER